MHNCDISVTLFAKGLGCFCLVGVNGCASRPPEEGEVSVMKEKWVKDEWGRELVESVT